MNKTPKDLSKIPTRTLIAEANARVIEVARRDYGLLPEVDLKVCSIVTGCGSVLPAALFYSKGKKSGLSHLCKTCDNAARAERLRAVRKAAAL